MSAPTIGAAPARIAATRYVTALREGGSLPALVEAEDDGLYVLKMRGPGQGPRALVAELLAGEIARAAGLPVPELALVDLDADLGRAEPDPEIQDLLRASVGLNLGMDYLPGALAYDPDAEQDVEPGLAAGIVWLDALLTNVDRTAANPNLLVWHGRLWMIDHGAALYRHHQDWTLRGAAARPFPAIADHVLLPVAGSVTGADSRLAPRVTDDVVEHVTGLLPDAWLADEEGVTPDRRRAAYRDHLFARTRDFLGMRVALDAGRLRALDPDADPAPVAAQLEGRARIAAGDPDAGPIARMAPHQRFHWLVAPSSTVVQPSAVHTGLCDDPAATLDRLFATLVG